MTNKETTNQQQENISQNPTETTLKTAENTETPTNQAVQARKKIFQHLDDVLDTSKEKFSRVKASNAARQKWARIIVAACSAYGSLLRDLELEEIELRLAKLEKRQEETERLRSEWR